MSNNAVLIQLLVLYFFNPFLGLVSSLSLLQRKLVNRVSYKYIIFFVALFFALVAFTQYTKEGDISRVYAGIISENVLFRSHFLDFLSDSNHIIFRVVNQLLYTVTGDVRFVSLLWVWVIYFFSLRAAQNILEYYEVSINKKIALLLTAAIVFCFINFTQVTEIMKQAVATALVFYSFSNIMIKRRVRALIAFIVALNIHLSPLFFIPLLFAKICPQIVLLVLLVISFFLRGLNAMDVTSSTLGGIEALNNLVMIEEIVDTAGDYSTGIDNFFRSSSLFFVLIFWHYAIIAFILFLENKESIIAKASIIMIIVLNLNYGVDHNYTRILTLMFPFYTLLLIEVIFLVKTKMIQVIKYVLIIFCLIVNIRLIYGRVGAGAYSTSFMDGSILNLFIYPSFLYLN